MIKSFCDRCGKEVSGLSEVFVALGLFSGDFELEVCSSCRKIIVEFLKAKKNVGITTDGPTVQEDPCYLCGH